VILAIWARIKLDRDGPAIYAGRRVGRGGREFRMYKFRTMVTNADRIGGPSTADTDPRLTTTGRFLRRYKLDELPQLVNVLRGQMSLVGPRPPLPEEVAAYPADMRRRLAVRPGLTGLWQVSGRSDLPFEEAVKLDLRYVENWSFTLDLVILARTLAAVWRAAGAY
jgi:lipopolysaccharide/colanic/teichoic acid biosynthesis glycosyltransferase